MQNNPLDFQTQYNPSDEDRPAGEWLERDWESIATWATWLGILCAAYAVWLGLDGAYRLYRTPAKLTSLPIIFLTYWMYCLVLIPVAYLAYRFGSGLKQALQETNQFALQTAFQTLHRLLVAMLLVAALGAVQQVSSWYVSISMVNQWEQSKKPSLPIPTDESSK
jgi:hypothetical protein